MAVKINPRKDLELPKNTTHSLKVFGLAVLGVLFALIHIWTRTWVVKKEYEMGEVQSQLRKLESDWTALRVERNQLYSPKSMENWVRLFEEKGIKLAPPKKEQILFIERDSL